MHPLRRATLALATAAISTLALPSCSVFRLGGGDQEDGVPPAEETSAAAEAADERAAEARQAARVQEPLDRGAVTKVKPFHLQPDKDYTAADPSIPFEAQYRLHGAITREERLARYGHYYTVFWKAENRSAPVTLLFEYRQRETGSEASSTEVVVDEPGRRNQTEIRITGSEYFEKGAVTSWRITLTQDGQVIGRDRSFLWK